jgi:hypothetical protein
MALEIGPEEFRAAKQTACVLAQDSLGYLAEDDYDALLEDVLKAFDEAERDTIFAKALGYYDGLMFEIPANNSRLVAERLTVYVESEHCIALRDAALPRVTGL